MPTIRQKIISLLINEEMSAREISGQVGVSEKEINEHLAHIARSVASQNQRPLPQVDGPRRTVVVGDFTALGSFVQHERTIAAGHLPRAS